MKVTDAKKVYNFRCSKCHKDKTHNVKESCGGTGYANKKDGSKICYDCCAIEDSESMTETGRITLYLTGENRQYSDGSTGNWYPTKITNWPGTLKFNVLSYSLGRHNWGFDRWDVWFIGPDRRVWWGVHSGYNSQLIHCKQTKHTGYSGDLARRYGLTLESA